MERLTRDHWRCLFARRCDLFLRLPSKRRLPLYYDVIERPIALGMIRSAADKGEYRTMSAFAADVRLVFANAKAFNEPNSAIWYNARYLLQVRPDAVARGREWSHWRCCTGLSRATAAHLRPRRLPSLSGAAAVQPDSRQGEAAGHTDEPARRQDAQDNTAIAHPRAKDCRREHAVSQSRCEATGACSGDTETGTFLRRGRADAGQRVNGVYPVIVRVPGDVLSET